MPDLNCSVLRLQKNQEVNRLPDFVNLEPNQQIQLSIVIVNYRQWKWTEQLVRKLSQSELIQKGKAEIIIIDNNSSYSPVIKRLRAKPFVSLRRWNKNRGFSCAVNEGCRLSVGQWILFLNPDITPCSSFLDDIDKYLKLNLVGDTKTGVIGFGLRNPDGTTQGSTGPFPTFWGTIARRFLPRAWRKYDLNENNIPKTVDWITGCCMLARRSCIEQLKKFDTDFFLYYEDVDLCKRVSQAGYKVFYEPALQVIHHAPIHTRRVPARLRVITRQALMTYAKKHWTNSEAKWICRLIRCEAFLMSFLSRLVGDSRAKKWFDRLGRYSNLIASGRLRIARGEFLAALAEPVLAEPVLLENIA